MSSHIQPLLLFGAAVVALLVAAGSGHMARRSWELRQAVDNASAATAGTVRAGQGPVELTGTAHSAEHTFTSPLTQQECVAYRFEKEVRQKERHHDPDGGTDTTYEWVTALSDEAGAPFYLEDGQGEVLVDGSTADLEMERSYELTTDDVTEGIGETVAGLLGADSDAEDHDVPQEYVEEIRDSNRKRRYTEQVVHEGEEVYVYGEAVAPEQTPLRSGTGDLAASAMGGLTSGSVLGALTGLFGGAVDAATDPKQRYKPRAFQRLPDAEPAEAAPTDHSQQAQEMAEQMQGLSEDEIRDDPDARQNMMDMASEMMEQSTQAASEAAERARPETPHLDDAPVVVSWGSQAPTFVVSDQGKGAVVRDFSTGTLKYGAVSLLAVVAAVGAVAVALGVV